MAMFSNPLEEALSILAEATWERLRDVKAFSAHTLPFDSVRLGEETITDLSMLDLRRKRLIRVIFLQTPKHIEADRGTDFEWWLGSNRGGWFRLAIQAKKLDLKTNRYSGLTQKTPTGMDQIEALEKYANGRADALYCFYNYYDSVDLSRHWHCCGRQPYRNPREQELGCTLAPSSLVQKAIDKHGAKNFEFIHNDKRTLPWQCLASCPKIQTALVSAAENLSDDPFPLIDPASSYYPQLPLSFQVQVSTRRSMLDDRPDDGAVRVEVLEFDASLSDYYDPEVGLPKRIFISEIDL